MTVNVAGRRARAPRKAEAGSEAPIAIGEFEQTVFSCPACNRPLALGVGRCPGCGTRFLMRVELRRASILIGLGLLVGLTVGGGLTAASLALDRPAREAEIAAAAAAAALAGVGTDTDRVATSRPIATPGTGGSSGSGSGATSGIPAITRSALGQAAAVDGRLASSAIVLAAATSAADFDAIEVSAILRSLSADAVFALKLTPHIASWSGGQQVSDRLAAFYTEVQRTAAEGLTASIRNEAAYRLAATTMLGVLGGLAELDADVRAAAARAGVTIE
jgi:hypothetical protein